MLRNLSLTCAMLAATAFAQNYPDSIPAGTRIRVRADQTIDARADAQGRVYPATIAEDVFSSDGRRMIPRGSRAELIAGRVGEHEMPVALESITMNGRRYMVDASTYERSRRSGVGANKRTGEFVGGGALFGTIVGALA